MPYLSIQDSAYLHISKGTLAYDTEGELPLFATRGGCTQTLTPSNQGRLQDILVLFSRCECPTLNLLGGGGGGGGLKDKKKHVMDWQEKV